ncbi:hypothetical protein [Bradyrhizobium centrosematis]|uniref:hypothetical protein n=1 Tax=Bradyrhizobium centrosematis TaxID=1300039 RepID=UPI002168E7DC|nr:hypothetical protein [Bradyrhizobium centrosematis]MCS3761656.1 hypothetical protein [Bradyrhizobium centrosematis]MCS3774324.1 hypothetical protein [Bradyrhizobium centrosematis]
MTTSPLPDQFVPDPIVANEFNISLMTLWRWSRDPNLGFPAAIQIRGKNFRSRSEIEAFKERMLMGALRQRSEKFVSQKPDSLVATRKSPQNPG